MGRICNKNRLTRIYYLANPITGEPRYVGKTVNSLHDRLGQHFYDATRVHRHSACWIKSLKKRNLDPLIIEIDRCEWRDSQFVEMYWIAQFRAWGFNLVNHSIGGEGVLGYKASDETIRKRSKAMMKYAKRVYQYNLQGEYMGAWTSAKMASEATNARYGNILQCCRGEKKSAGGYQWRFTKTPNIEPWKKNPQRRTNYDTNNFYKTKRAIKIINFETGEIVVCASMREAELLTRVNKTSICMECRGQRKARGIYKFKYCENEKQQNSRP